MIGSGSGFSSQASKRAVRSHSAYSRPIPSSRRANGSTRVPKPVRTALEMADVFSQLRAAAGSAPGPPPPPPPPPALARLRRRVQDLRNLREEAFLRPEPEPLDGGDEAALQPEPPARPRLSRREGHAGVEFARAASRAEKSRKPSEQPARAGPASNTAWRTAHSPSRPSLDG